MIDAAMSDDTNQGIYKGGFFGPYKSGLWPYQAAKFYHRAPANPWLEPIKSRYKGPIAGGNTQSPRLACRDAAYYNQGPGY